MEASIESKRKEEQDLNEQDIVAHRRLRDATAAAAVECKQHIENCDENLKFLKKQVTSFKLTCFVKGIVVLNSFNQYLICDFCLMNCDISVV